MLYLSKSKDAKPLMYSIMGGFELLNQSLLEIEKNSRIIFANKTYEPNHKKKKRGKFKRSGKK